MISKNQIQNDRKRWQEKNMNSDGFSGIKKNNYRKKPDKQIKKKREKSLQAEEMAQWDRDSEGKDRFKVG